MEQPSGDGPLKIKWDDVERTTIDGIFIVGGKSVLVSKSAIDVWRRRPDATFNTRTPLGDFDEKIDLVLWDQENPPSKP